MSLDWGTAEPSHPLADVPWTDRAPETPDQLPEVRRLVAAGWELAPDAPFLAFLPAVWPPHARTWVPDRATKYLIEYRDGEPPERKPWAHREYWEAAHEQAQLLSLAGVSPAPPGRLWLLRPPPALRSVGAVLDHITARAGAVDIPIGCVPEYVEIAADEIRSAFSWTS